MTLPQHLSQSNEWFTPPDVIEAARATLGGTIELDPASCFEANQIVKAERYYTEADDGFTKEWRGTTLCNPPGGKRKPCAQYPTKSNAAAWFWKLLYEAFAGRVTAGVFVGFNIELLRNGQGLGSSFSPLSFPLCVPSKRLQFGGAPHPTHANAIIYLGPKPRVFEREFKHIGQVRL